MLLSWLGLSRDERSPLQVLARTGGVKNTDNLQIFPELDLIEKVNKKSEGSWFQLFMDFQLNYIGGNLCDFDDEDAAEILIELFPRKVMCSDSQAKTIIPELIAVWQFLHRELNSGQKRQLEFAEGVIGFLKGIKKDYLAIFKGEIDIGLNMGEDMFDELMMQAQSEQGGYSWVNGQKLALAKAGFLMIESFRN